MPGYHRVIWSGVPGLLCPPRLLGQAAYSGSRGQILQGVVSRFLVGDSGGPADLHNFKFFGGCSGASLDIAGKRRQRRS